MNFFKFLKIQKEIFDTFSFTLTVEKIFLKTRKQKKKRKIKILLRNFIIIKFFATIFIIYGKNSFEEFLHLLNFFYVTFDFFLI